MLNDKVLDDNQLCYFYNKCHVILVPSPPYAEGFSLASAEALACGTPVIATDIPAIRESVGKYAYYVPYKAEAFAEKACWIFKNYENARKKP